MAAAPMAFEDLRLRLERLLDDARRATDPRASAGGMHDAMVEIKVALSNLSDALVKTERELASERTQLADAERRGRLATAAGDEETVGVAARFVTRHTERVAVLERRLAVQQDEMMLLERDYAELSESYRMARRGIPPTSQPRVTEADLELPDVAAERELDGMERRASREELDAAVQAQLAALKAKLGKP
ncbi:MAG TPA: hypothetical protein VMK53_01540 [Gemmatimonadales bacterium]|nr:hypothetical protein [Gemmatimonadales bacterium]